MSDFHKMQEEALKIKAMKAQGIPIVDEVPKPTDIFVVWAWNKNQGWRLRCKNRFEEFKTYLEAEEHARCLPAIWTHRTVVKVSLPAKEEP